MSTRSLKDIIETAGYETRSYSGRGMYGKECLAVDLDTSELEFFADLLDNARSTDLETIADAMRGALKDSMGRGMVVYFPDIAE